ncbi:MAG: hypothetical protein WDW36_001782 [Sanguina aurantia]
MAGTWVKDEDSEEESELDFAESFKELDLPKEAQIILLDSDGSEAAAAVEALYKGGVPRSRKILFVTGGFSGTDGWKESEQPWKPSSVPLQIISSVTSVVSVLAQTIAATATTKDSSTLTSVLAVAGVLGGATLLVYRFEDVMQVVGTLVAGKFLLGNLIFAEDRAQTAAFVKDRCRSIDGGTQRHRTRLRDSLSLSCVAGLGRSGSQSQCAALVLSAERTAQSFAGRILRQAVVDTDSSMSVQRLGKGEDAEPAEEEEKPVAPVAVKQAVKAVAAAVKEVVVVPAKSEVKVAAAVAKVKEVEAVPLIKADPAENVREARAWIENWKASRDDPPPPEKEVPENVKEARAWIENWKATKDAPPAPENEVPENVKEARAWIANWKASKDVPPAPEKEAPENVKEARAWIANWKEAAAAAAPAKEVEKALPAKPATAVEPEYVKEGDNWVLNYKAFLRPAAAKAAVAAAPAAQAKPVPENVKETRDWIAGWKAKLAAESAASNGTGMQSADVRQ